MQDSFLLFAEVGHLHKARVPEMSPDRGKKREKYASRSCLACRKRKVKCELNNLQIPSSLNALSKEDACEHCKWRGIDCIVWDGERKSKRYTIESSSITSKRQSQSTTSRAESRIDRDQILTPFYPFKPTFRPTQDGTEHVQATNAGRSTTHTRNEAMNEKVKLLSIIRRPMLMMTQILERQDKFRCGIPPSVGMVDFDCSFLSEEAYNVYDLGLIIQHPHLPRIRELYALQQSSPNPSRKFLLYTMLFLCRSKSPTEDKDETAYIQKTIYQLALHSTLNAPRSIEAAQALELLAVHCPFLLATSEGKDERRLTSQEEGSTAGSVMIAIAIKIVLSLGLEPESMDRQNVLWTSLCSWELALSFHDHSPIQPRKMNIPKFDDLNKSIAFTQEDDESECVGKIARSIGCTALYFRSRAVLESGKAELESEAILQELKDAKQMQSRQGNVLDTFKANMIEEEYDRCRTLNKIKADLRGESLIAHKVCSHAKLLLAMTDMIWLWLDLEAIGMHYILLSKALGSMHTFLLQTRDEDQLSVGQSIEASNSIFRIDFRQRIWEDPEWSEHVAVYGRLRNKVILSYISRSCQLRQHVQDIQHALDAVPPHEKQEQHCRAFVPMPLLSAILVNATKSLLDTQIVLLQAWNHVHEDTDMYMVIIRQAGEMLSDERMDVRLMNPVTGEHESGIGECCAEILRIIADTMSDWQNKQKIVIANHREKQKNRSTIQEDQQIMNESNVMQIPSSSINAPEDPMLVDSLYQIAGDQTQSSTPAIFDQLPTLNNLFEGMLEISDLNDFIASMNQRQNSFSLG